jgi:RNase P/RNase MRP subunit POP5
MQVNIELSQQDLEKLILEHLRKVLGEVDLAARDVTLLVKSKQNYKSEWEQAAFKAVVNKQT